MRRIISLLLVAAVAGLALTGCVPSDIKTFSTMRKASVRGTEVCVVNNTEMRMRITWRGYGARSIARDGKDCNSGYESGNNADVAALIEYEPAMYPGTWLELNLTGRNPYFGEPRVDVWYRAMGGNWGAYGRGDVGTENSFQQGWVHIAILRGEDTEKNKEWSVTISPPNGEDYVQDVGYQLGGAMV